MGSLNTEVSGVSIDSRSLRPGDLFIALRGERFDGHDYVEAALTAGACGAVVERGTWTATSAAARAKPAGEAPPPNAMSNLYLVDDTLEALGALAREVPKVGRSRTRDHRRRGKTSTKNILAAMVARRAASR
jgi:UDP-N-acetylmuramoyl-tripeptide--D-alanyl-D-alanine ligase